uniref:Retrotransposon protein, putative, Ty1-copia subclass n=1 Tax=Tanacetum cinerariifolium TaxID=118510 RepID=A0A699SGC3_TANCI|nr:retrotransposon protein, putative, Ty1-copia subclass [Tanacetum cinerariifolium]
MKGLMDQLHTLGKPYDNDMVVNLINRSLNKDFGDFRNCPLYLEELRANKKKSEPSAAVSGNLFAIELFYLTYRLNSWVYDTGYGIHVCNTLRGFKEERKLSYGVQYLQVGNGTQATVEAIGMFDLVLPLGLVLKL